MNDEKDLVEISDTETIPNILRRHIVEDPKKKTLAGHRLWLDSVQHEYPLPYIPYKIGVYIRFFNQTDYPDDVYLNKHKQQFADDIALCPLWTLVDYYVDYGSRAPRAEKSDEWCRLLDDALTGKVDLIVTQKVSNVSDNPGEITFISSVLAAQKHPVGMYFISDDIYTLASYYQDDISQNDMLPDGWHILPDE